LAPQRAGVGDGPPSLLLPQVLVGLLLLLTAAVRLINLALRH
jgi:hypothetical protein